MISASLLERAALDELEPGWRKRGYTLIREPSTDQLPPFLKNFQPDAIAIGASPHLVVEVVRARAGTTQTRVRQLRDLMKGHDNWRLELVYLPQERAPLAAVSWADIRGTLQAIHETAESEPRAGLLLAWATLEAVVRAIEPTLASRSLSPRSLVDVLVSNGHVDQKDGSKLRRMGDLRNALAHGQIDKLPDVEDVDFVATISERLLAA